jgi:nucleoside-diphosphate-sugar epimerase
MDGFHTVLGATGALGSAIVFHLEAEGLPIRAVARDVERAADMLPDDNEIEIVACDAVDFESVKVACADSEVIYNCLYVGDQARLVAENLMAGARESGARLVFPSNASVYGPLQHAPVKEDHALQPVNRRGQERMEVEAMLMEAHDKGDVQVVIPRLATFYGAHLRGSFMSAIFDAAQSGQKAYWFGRLDMPHDFAYLPDAAAACVLLGMNQDALGQVWHIPGAGPMTGGEFIQRVFQAFGNPPKIGARGRSFFQFAGVIAPQVREMLEVMYQFEQPFTMDGSKFVSAYPNFEFTPHQVGIEDTVEWFKEARVDAA